jgi:hypothetical protein
MAPSYRAAAAVMIARRTIRGARIGVVSDGRPFSEDAPGRHAVEARDSIESPRLHRAETGPRGLAIGANGIAHILSATICRMLSNLGLAVPLVFATVVIHSTATMVVLRWTRSQRAIDQTQATLWKRTLVIAAGVVSMFLVSCLESLLWAAVYLAVGALRSVEEAIYFSLVTFTTLGYGDLTLQEEWRILAALQAANGIIMFGWTTAIIVALIQRMTLHPPTGESQS